jgi:alpha-D-ribose 1-methylphosphonate 5-triphosphate synthase subunit PhnG
MFCGHCHVFDTCQTGISYRVCSLLATLHGEGMACGQGRAKEHVLLTTAAVAALQVPDDDAEMDGEEMEQLHEEIEADYDAGDTIKTKLIPHAVAW